MTVRVPYVREMTFAYGALEPVAPGIRRIVARNPGAFTFHGTGTYVVGEGEVAVIDPGPELAEHVEALLAGLAANDERITHQIVTHTHLDHSPAARLVRARTGAPTYGFGPHARGPGEGGTVEEGGDEDFAPDVVVRHGEAVRGKGWTLEAVHTPGHTSNHLCFALRETRALFSGDHVMGWSTTVIAPPDGDMARYMASLEAVRARGDTVLWPTHGPPVTDPQGHIGALIAHRLEREGQILACIAQGVGRIPDMVAVIYRDVPRTLHGAAGYSVLAHLIQLVTEGRVRCEGEPLLGSFYKGGTR